MEKIIVVFVDDKEGVRDALEITLEDYFEGKGIETYSLFPLADPKDALNLTSNFQVDVLITDLQMPKMMGGDELVREMKVLSPATALILMTGKDGYAPPKDLPIDGFLEKPIDEERLFAVLDKVLEDFFSG